MVDIFNSLSSLLVPYFNEKVGWSREDWMSRLKTSTTVYVDNMSFYTAEEQVHFFFSQVGLVKKVIMGLNRHSFRPAGFCFVEFYQRQHAVDAVCFCNGATLDDMEIRCELDPGFQKGREFGYGLSGGQSIDDLRLKPHSERPREQFVPWRNRAEYIRAKQLMGSTACRSAEVLTADDAAAEAEEGAEPVKKQRPLALVTERYVAELASARNYERPSASLRGRRRRGGDLSMPDGDDSVVDAEAAATAAAGEANGERREEGDGEASRGRRDRSRSASP